MAGSGWIIRYLRAILAAALLLTASVTRAQMPAAEEMPPQTVEDALHQMSDKAGVIFAGQVTAVHRQAGGDGASGFVEIEFRVDQAIRGCTAGTPYVLREWAGLWVGGARRYHVGQRLLMFLRAPSASGLSSPVDGMDGAVPIHGGSPSLVATGSTAQYPVADLRWIGAKLLHPVSYRAVSPHPDHRAGTPVSLLRPQVIAQAGSFGVESANVMVEPMSISSGGSAPPAQQTPVQAVVGMLRSWQMAKDAAR